PPGSFNPLPPRRAGATEPATCAALVCVVSILSRPEGREPRHHRVQRRDLVDKFQSSPAPKGGSHWERPTLAHPDDVSILSRPEGREPLGLLRLLPGAEGASFNP